MSSNKYQDSPEFQSLRINPRSNTMNQSVQEFPTYKEKMQDLMLPKADFVEQDQFKKSPNCIVCEIEFSQVNRQHHCRMCGNSCCSRCSEKTINKNRVCDICYLKASQIAAENRRKKFLSALKDQGKKLKHHIENATKRKAEQEEETKKQEQQSRNDLKTIEKETEQYRLQYTQKAQDKVAMEEQLNQIKELMSKLNQRKDTLIVDFQEREQEIRAYDTNLYLKGQELNDRKTQLNRLKKQKDDLENASTQIESNPEVIIPEAITEEPQSLQQYNTNIDIDEMMNDTSYETKDLVPKATQQEQDQPVNEEQEKYKCNIF